MQHLILFGGISGNFVDLSCRILFEGKKTIGFMALLLQNDEIVKSFQPIIHLWQEHVSGIDIILLSDADWERKAIDVVNAASIIVIGPGKTMKYRDAIMGNAVGSIIIKKVSEGIPYAGISAGAMLAGERLTRDTEAGVAVFPALGLIKGVCIEPHFDVPGREGSLRYQMDHTGLKWGLGIGNAACASVSHDGCGVAGDGLCVLRQRLADGSETEVKYTEGDQFLFI